MEKHQQAWHCFLKNKNHPRYNRPNTIFWNKNASSRIYTQGPTVWNIHEYTINMRIRLYSNQNLTIVSTNLCKQLFGASFAHGQRNIPNMFQTLRFGYLAILQHAWKSCAGQLLLHASFSQAIPLELKGKYEIWNKNTTFDYTRLHYCHLSSDSWVPYNPSCSLAFMQHRLHCVLVGGLVTLVPTWT